MTVRPGPAPWPAWPKCSARGTDRQGRMPARRKAPPAVRGRTPRPRAGDRGLIAESCLHLASGPRTLEISMEVRFMSSRAAFSVLLGGMILALAGCASSPSTPPKAAAPPPPVGVKVPPPMPAAPAEVQTAQPGTGYVWIPGHYEWRSSSRSYVWVPGSWAVPPADQTWVPGHWETRPNGSVWVQSHWQATASP